jgi:hypothetical protein
MPARFAAGLRFRSFFAAAFQIILKKKNVMLSAAEA